MSSFCAEIARTPGWLLRWEVSVHEKPDDRTDISIFTERDSWTCVFHRSAVHTARRWVRRRQLETALAAAPRERIEETWAAYRDAYDIGYLGVKWRREGWPARRRRLRRTGG
jgi:hypothetical protein